MPSSQHPASESELDFDKAANLKHPKPNNNSTGSDQTIFHHTTNTPEKREHLIATMLTTNQQILYFLEIVY